MTEIWKPIDGYEGVYEVSNLGRVRSLDRIHCMKTRWGAKATRRTQSRLLKEIAHTNGYCQIILSKQGIKRHHRIHRLVASAFCEKKPGCNVVNHIDNNPKNNRADNLEWVTQKTNVYHAAGIGAITVRPVIRFDGETEMRYPSVREAERDGFNSSGIVACCKGKYKTHKGYSWRYADE